MRIALLYSGMPGALSNIEYIYLNHYKYIISKYSNIDIYYSTYNYDKYSMLYINKFYSIFQPKHIHIENFNEISNKYLYHIINSVHFKTVKETNVINSLSMFYKIQKVFDIIKDQNYDIIIRNRTDILFDSALDLDYNQYLNVPAGGDWYGGLMDIFAYGSYDVMERYSKLYSYIEEYIHDTNFIFHPEMALRYHCIIQKIKVHRFNYNIFLRGENFCNSAPCYIF